MAEDTPRRLRVRYRPKPTPPSPVIISEDVFRALRFYGLPNRDTVSCMQDPACMYANGRWLVLYTVVAVSFRLFDDKCAPV